MMFHVHCTLTIASVLDLIEMATDDLAGKVFVTEFMENNNATQSCCCFVRTERFVLLDVCDLYFAHLPYLRCLVLSGMCVLQLVLHCSIHMIHGCILSCATWISVVIVSATCLVPKFTHCHHR
jgi:hypothetical protein